MSVLHRIAFAMELLGAEWIFLFPLPKKKRFPLRYLAAVLICVAVSYVCLFKTDILPVPVLQLVRLVLVYGATIGAMCCCFDCRPQSVISACAAGYAVEHITFQIVKILGMSTGILADSLWGIPRWELMEYLFFPPIYLVFGLTLGLYAQANHCFQQADARLSVPFFTIFAVTIGLTRIADTLGENASITVSLYAIACCGMALAVQLILFRLISMQCERDAVQFLWREKKRQYEIEKKTVDLINVKHHDLKKKLTEMKAALSREDIDSIEKATAVYDCKVKTGSDVLDVLLTQRTMLCQSEGITLTYTGNGADFSFLSMMDAYSLFGNAIDNAIEAVRKVERPDKRMIDIVTERKGSLMMLIVKNYFRGPLVVEHGFPVTTKREEQGYHGFGIRSMNMLAERYDGRVDIRLQDDLFVLTASLFAPAAQSGETPTA